MASVLFHRLMTPEWLTKSGHAEFNCEYTKTDLELRIQGDSAENENIFKVPLIADSILDDRADITVRIKVGVVLPEPAAPRPDPILFMISDNDSGAIGFKLRNPSQSDYRTLGPYFGIDGSPGRILDQYKKRSTDVPTNSQVNPDQFEILLKPSDYWGSIYSALDGGHKLNTIFAKKLRLSRGLWLDVYRDQRDETYVINYIEVTVYNDNPPLAP